MSAISLTTEKNKRTKRRPKVKISPTIDDESSTMHTENTSKDDSWVGSSVAAAADDLLEICDDVIKVRNAIHDTLLSLKRGKAQQVNELMALRLHYFSTIPISKKPHMRDCFRDFNIENPEQLLPSLFAHSCAGKCCREKVSRMMKSALEREESWSQHFRKKKKQVDEFKFAESELLEKMNSKLSFLMEKYKEIKHLDE